MIFFSENVSYDTIRFDSRCCFNVRSKADISQLNLPHGTKKVEKEELKIQNRICSEVKPRLFWTPHPTKVPGYASSCGGGCCSDAIVMLYYLSCYLESIRPPPCVPSPLPTAINREFFRRRDARCYSLAGDVYRHNFYRVESRPCAPVSSPSACTEYIDLVIGNKSKHAPAHKVATDPPRRYGLYA